MKKIVFFGLLLFWVLSGIVAQDGLYTQHLNAPLYTNPAHTGAEPGDLRLGLNYRSQWAKVAAPYRNIGAYVDIRRKNLGWGLLLNKNDAGAASMQRSLLNIAFAFHKQLSNGKNELSLGTALGLVQQRFDPAAFSYDQQYQDKNGFDPLRSSGEQFEQTHLLLPDFNIGFRFKWSDFLSQDRMGGQVGLSFAHVNQSGASFFNELVEFPMRINLEVLLDFSVNSNWSIQPQFLWSRQQLAEHGQISLLANYHLADTRTLSFGAGLRRKDAVLLLGALKWPAWTLGLSYDNTISGLDLARPGSGTIELSAMIYLNKVEKKEKSESPNFWGAAAESKSFTGKGFRDIDGDGIADENDLCPYQPGSIDLQGCNDEDGDGIWDHVDACPELSGKTANYGCPPKKAPSKDKEVVVYPAPQRPKRIAARISTEVVEFETDQAIIRPQYFPMLDRLAYDLRFNENYYLQLEGHTDSEGDAIYNYHLSQRRVIAVQQYLMERGLTHDRLAITYYGESKPKMANEGVEAKARNRRTELILWSY